MLYKYIGTKHLVAGKALVIGALVELTERQFHNLRDKFVPVGEEALASPLFKPAEFRVLDVDRASAEAAKTKAETDYLDQLAKQQESDEEAKIMAELKAEAERVAAEAEK